MALGGRARAGWTTAVVAGVLGVALTVAAGGDGPLIGEVGLSRWSRDHTPGVLDPLAELFDLLLPDL
ncbi:MAG: hypothetical protein CL441_07575, partial [Acidimicrobiaceae bacterium]|nr:hypothetical protein [Acidimicrobiaceae bacterium]